MSDTNADTIRSMTDEKLADYLCELHDSHETGCDRCQAAEYCKLRHKGMIDWPRQPQSIYKE